MLISTLHVMFYNIASNLPQHLGIMPYFIYEKTEIQRGPMTFRVHIATKWQCYYEVLKQFCLDPKLLFLHSAWCFL